ncbi:GTPase Der [Lentibacillus sp. JNUCC-1]|uniref:GTPase family protein n=1 Tax=Lentibacillus sp. JNUCC-1 TaxID=2654513 RepID=UPI0012E79DE6|nr:GTPase [Lentibacillus sp. JNUCC-1]MUV36998.1 GTPase Der [Lentibacillus sp. JNUCC-1]
MSQDQGGNNNRNEQVEDLMHSISEALQGSRLPEKVKGIVQEELNNLRAFTLDARPARIAIVGRRGAGKSSLINAIFGEQRAEIGDVKAQTGAGKWYAYESELGSLEILDTRGLGEADKPGEAFEHGSALEEVKASIEEKCPDAILFLSKAKEVSARIDEDLQQLLDLKQSIRAAHAYDVPIVGAVTQVDELSPKKPDTPPFDHPVKQQNISEAVDILTGKLSDAVSEPVKVIPLCCYLEFEDGKIVYDIRWNVDTLLDYLIQQLPNEAQIILAKLSKIRSVQKKIARRIGRSVAGMTGVVGANPIPLSDLPVITGMQTVMVTIIALISGQKIDRKGVLEFFGALGVNVAAGFALRQVARQLVKFVPVAGNVVSGAVASAGTYALCEAAIAYFIEDEPITRVKDIYKRVFRRKKKENQDDT